MAQVLLDQKTNQIRLKRGFYKLAKKLLASDIHSGNSNVVSIQMRKSAKIAAQKRNERERIESSIKMNMNNNVENSESCSNEEHTSSGNLTESYCSKKRGFSCMICGYLASSTERLKEHIGHHTGVKHLECEVCGKKFSWRYSLKIHLACHKEDNPNKCSICGKKYCNKAAVKNHILRVHSDTKKEYKCDKCEKNFITKSELERHFYNHSKDKPFVCEYCGNSYRFKAGLSDHYRVHTGEKPFKCEFCEKTFTHLSSAVGHRRLHTGELPFQCKECGKCFSVKKSLTAHMIVHSDTKPFKCDKCHKAFKSRSGFRVHQDFHLGLKRYQCKFCDKTFRAWCNMHKHSKRHLTDKSFKCDMCDKTFSVRQELKSHKKDHFASSKKNGKLNENLDTIVNNCVQIIPSTTLTCTATPLENSGAFNESHNDSIMQTHIDLTDNQPVMYDCSLPTSIEKSSDKCQLLQDTYITQFLYPQYTNVQYSTQSVPMMNMYPTEPSPVLNRSSCLPASFNCIQSNNNAYNNFSYNLPQSEELLLKCKLCRSLFQSTIALRGHLLEYHRIEEENIDALIN